MVEVALIMPFLLLLIFGIIDVGRILMLNQVADTASREAVRRAIVPGMTQVEVLATANFYLDSAKVSQTGREILILNGEGNSTTLDTINSNEYVSVQITVPYDRNTWGVEFNHGGSFPGPPVRGPLGIGNQIDVEENAEGQAVHVSLTALGRLRYVAPFMARKSMMCFVITIKSR